MNIVHKLKVLKSIKSVKYYIIKELIKDVSSY